MELYKNLCREFLLKIMYSFFTDVKHENEFLFSYFCIDLFKNAVLFLKLRKQFYVSYFKIAFICVEFIKT